MHNGYAGAAGESQDIKANLKRHSVPESSSTSSHDTEFWVNQKRDERKVSEESVLSSKTSKGSTNKRTSSSDDTQFWVGLQEEKKRGERQQNGLQTDKQEPPDALQETKEAPDQVDVEDVPLGNKNQENPKILLESHGESAASQGSDSSSGDTAMWVSNLKSEQHEKPIADQFEHPVTQTGQLERKDATEQEELMSPSLTQIKSESSEYATAMNLSGIFGRDFSCDQAFSKSECLTYDKIDDAEDKREQKCAEVMKDIPGEPEPSFSTSSGPNWLLHERQTGEPMVVTPDYDYAKINHSKSERTRSPSDGSLVGTRNLNLLEAKKGDELSPRSAFLKNPRPETVETTENTMEHAKPEEQVHHMAIIEENTLTTVGSRQVTLKKKDLNAPDSTAATGAASHSTGSQIDYYRFPRRSSEEALNPNTLSAQQYQCAYTPYAVRLADPRSSRENPRSYGTSTTMEAMMVYTRGSNERNNQNKGYENSADGFFLHESFSFQKPSRDDDEDDDFITAGSNVSELDSFSETFATAAVTPNANWAKDYAKNVSESMAEAFSTIEGTYAPIGLSSDSLILRKQMKQGTNIAVPDPESFSEVEPPMFGPDLEKHEYRKCEKSSSSQSSVSSKTVVRSSSSSCHQNKSSNSNRIYIPTEYSIKSSSGVPLSQGYLPKVASSKDMERKLSSLDSNDDDTVPKASDEPPSPLCINSKDVGSKTTSIVGGNQGLCETKSEPPNQGPPKSTDDDGVKNSRVTSTESNRSEGQNGVGLIKTNSVRFQNPPPPIAASSVASNANLQNDIVRRTPAMSHNTNSSLGKSTNLDFSTAKTVEGKSEHFTEKSRCLREWQEKHYELPYTVLRHTRPPDFTQSCDITELTRETTPTGANDAVQSIQHPFIDVHNSGKFVSTRKKDSQNNIKLHDVTMNEGDEKETEKSPEPDYDNQEADAVPGQAKQSRENSTELLPDSSEYKTTGILCCKKKVKIAKSYAVAS